MIPSYARTSAPGSDAVFAAAQAAAPLDPARAGTAEYLWAGVLGHCPEWTPGPGPLVVVSPHPDDEVLGAGGLIHTWADAGRDVRIVSVTDGEAAYPDWQGLDRVRRTELKCALRTLSVKHIEVTRLGLPDGRVAAHAQRLRASLLSTLEPDTTLIAPYECDGHPDHDAVGRVCAAVARARGIAIARYPVWAWHHAAPQALPRSALRRFFLNVPARRAKARAIQCFASQLHPAEGSPIVPAHVLGYFQRAFEAFLV